MPRKDGFSSDQSLPPFLQERTGNSEIVEPSDLAVFRSHALKATILTLAIVLGIAAFLVGNPMTLLADLTDSFGDKSTLHPGPDRSTSTIQTTSDAQATSSTTENQPTSGEITATEAAGEDPAKTVDAATEALFRQFQAWADEKDAQALESVQPVQPAPVEPVREAVSQPAQDGPLPKVAEEAQASLRLPRKHRHAPTTSHARTEMPRHAPRKMVRRPQREQVAPPRAAAVARDQVVQNAEPQFFPPGFFGSRD